MRFWRRRPKTAAELANDAEVDKLAKEALLGELDNEVTAHGSAFIDPLERGPSGFFESPGVDLPDDKPYDGPAEPSP